ncbi:hypothetical protein M0804_014130 [Polistes exclamans]|nr:hypothetical protein M0804_014130 [Polistes exclamans]
MNINKRTKPEIYNDPDMITNANIIANTYTGKPFIEIGGVPYDCSDTKLVQKIFMMQMKLFESQDQYFTLNLDVSRNEMEVLHRRLINDFITCEQNRQYHHISHLEA